ncbi:HAD family phosphatase [Rhodococcus aetherivorans]|uniref:HAD family hydrolase n=1 Tax=Rhodococcus TaxID=1827 RepID=UPI000C9B2BB3|nr:MULTISPECIES: HAD family phosphatase [Rhodococcus]MDV6297167.1 HAD family phosphatase [Rhodococcus aetherivorans]PND49826.1 HAD family hydrolase [Rhodococcus sp. ENV425]WKW99574.1 HAD family phosphatase [Rhodococcus aetherivorans]
MNLAAPISERTAVLVDFGGVITTSVFAAFEEFGATLGDPGLPLRLLGGDPISRGLLAEHESGRIDAEEFEQGFAERLRAHGAAVTAEGLAARMQAGMRRDDRTVALVDDLRAAGVPVALVSNAFGRDCYAGFDLAALADEVVISAEIGIRKPSRRIYALACERLGVAPEQAVMVDDLQQNLDGAARIGIAGVLHTDADTTRLQLAERFGFVTGRVPGQV